MENGIRLQKYLADNGIASRRKCEEYILEGKVRVNNEIVQVLGTKINPNKDIVYFEGKKLKNISREKIYVLINKPIGYVTTLKEQFGRPIVSDLINLKERLVPVGRLDMYTSGALILTNDGDFVYKITHPKHQINKTYVVTVKGEVSEEDLDRLRSGIKIDNYLTSKAKARILNYNKEKTITRLEIIIHEGKNRQVRKMCKAINKSVVALHRSKIGDIGVKDLKIGEWRFLNKEEINKLLV